jgi:hypothetical protein
MTFRNEPDVWASIRENLRLYMENSAKSAEQVAKYIEEHRADIAPTAKSRRAAIDHGTITRFVHIQNKTNTHRDKVEILYRFLVHTNTLSDPTIRFHNRPGSDPVYQLIQHFFGVRERNIEFCKSFIGSYRFFRRSEDFRNHVVIGAIKFDFNQAGDSFEVKEHQRINSSGAVEYWEGYCFARRSHLIVMLKGQGDILDNLPKFYILSPPHSNSTHLVIGTTGIMFKIGRGGGVFQANVLMRRDDEAFTKCDVLPNDHDDIPGDILAQI